MKRSKTYILASMSLVVALMSSSAVAAPKGNFKFQSSSTKSAQGVSRNLMQHSGQSTTSAMFNTTVASKFNSGNFATPVAKKSKLPVLNPGKLPYSPVLDPGKGNGSHAPFTPIGPIVDRGKRPFLPIGPVFQDRPWGPITDPGKGTGPFGPIGPIVDPGKGHGPFGPIGPIGDPNPPVGDPGNPPADPPANPPADPPANPCPPPSCPPHCPPYNPGYCGGGWGYPLPFPFPGGGFGGGYCGTTTVVQPVVAQPIVQEQVAAGTLDLELLEVQQLDRGDLAKNLGPAYRLTLRNKSGLAVAQQFNVTLAASLGRQATAESAFATQRVNGLEAGQLLAVEVRLPAKAYKMGLNADGQAVPFAYLTAVVDSHQELPEADRDNDFMVLGRGEIVMVAQK